MKIIAAKDYRQMSRYAANIISAQITLKPDSVLGLATGSSPLGIYQQLIHHYNNGDLDFRHVKTFNLDEYIGLDHHDEQSYAYFMHHNFFRHINIDLSNTRIPCGIHKDIPTECKTYDAEICSHGGIDLQLLGLGPNGHIGFNEPDDQFQKGTHAVDLAPATIDANKRFFEKEEDVPRRAITMGIANIMQAKHIVMIVSGRTKASILHDAFFGPITPRVPASILQLHQNFTLIADADALSMCLDTCQIV